MGFVKKAFKKVGKALGGLTKRLGGLLGLGGLVQQPQITLPAPAPTPAVQVMEPAQQTPEVETDGEESIGSSKRRGKGQLTVKRTPLGSGNGTNM